MTDYELAVLSPFGEHFKSIRSSDTLDYDNAKEAIAWTYWPIGGVHWFLTDYSEKPCVRVRWTRKGSGRDGRTIQYTKFYTNQRFRNFMKLREAVDYRVDFEDFLNMMMGKDYVLYAEQDDNGMEVKGMPELFESSDALYEHYDYRSSHRMIINYRWIHRRDEEKDRQEFLSQFEEGKE